MTDEIVSQENPVTDQPEKTGATFTPAKRRGRPPKNPPADGNPNPVSDELAKSPRGRKPGRKPKVSFSGEDISTLSKQIVGLHKLASLASGIPELEIGDDEGAMLGAAVANVAQEYNLELNGKTGAMLQLIAACGMIYVPRFMHLQKRVAQMKAEKKGQLHVVGGTETTGS